MKTVIRVAAALAFSLALAPSAQAATSLHMRMFPQQTVICKGAHVYLPGIIKGKTGGSEARARP